MTGRSGAPLGRPAALLALLLSVAGATRAESPPTIFTDVTREAGIDFVHRFGDHDLSNIVEGTGAGAVFFDYDGDGDLDIFFLNGAWTQGVSDNRGREYRDRLSDALYRNNGNGTFTDVTRAAGVGDRAFGFAASAADYDGDGDLDLYVLNYGANVMYRNDGDGTFTDVTSRSGLGDPRWSLSAPWLDYDGDGDLDVFVANYLEYDEGKFRSYYAAAGYPGPLAYAGQPDALYRNNGDGTFSDVTREAGLFRPEGRAMSAIAADLNGDGRLDLYVANDAMANDYFENAGGGRFADRGLLAGLAYGEHGQGVSSMGPFAGDVDGDGALDLFIPDMGYGTLLMNRGDQFEDRTADSKLALICGQYTGWGGILFDYDNDGDLDAFVANGNAHHEYPEEAVLAANDGRGGFVDVAADSGSYFGEKYVGRGSTWGDYDNDGDIDLLVVHLNAPARLLRNDGGNRNNWLKVEARLPGGRREAIGARVTVTRRGARQVADVVGVMGYLSQGDTRPHFGLGRDEKADSVAILWPDGTRQVMKDVPANRIVRVIQGDGDTDDGKRDAAAPSDGPRPAE
jgi:hypothetical protein